MLTILTDTHSAACRFIYEMRHKDIQIQRGRFRNNMKRLAMAMALRISEKFPYHGVHCPTPLGDKHMDIPAEMPVLITILRAGGPFLNGFLEIFDESDVGFIGAFRLESGDRMKGIEMSYKALPETRGKTVILLDPMLATGNSMVSAADLIQENGIPEKIIFASAVAVPEGIEFIQQQIKIPYEIYVGACDETLNASSYIVPGLGDAGDLSYGPKI
ncbi:MAG: uracil phosphoribosyltransferase [Cyclobacteriaceae bacterium]